jgi:hypothetical protein
MSNTLIAIAEQIEQTTLGVAIAESRYAFPVIEGAHLLGLALSVGLIFMTDLRLLGWLFTKIPQFYFLRQLRIWTLIGFALTFASGVLLFVAEASAMIASPAFAVKLVFILLAGINLLYFERVMSRLQPTEETVTRVSGKLKTSATVSLILWILIIVCGRLIPYLPAWS